MPMYEKGSVRAEPRSKQQERMKKIMKKFLSSLLALTMILSLVIVPANATDGSGASMSKSTLSLKVGATSGNQLSVTISDPKDSDGNAIPSDAQKTYTWQSSAAGVATVTAVPSDNSKATIDAIAKGEANITCKVAYSWTDNSTEKAAEQTVSCTLTVTNEQDAFNAAAKKVTYNGRKYSVTDNSAKVYFFAGDTLDTSKLGIEVTGSAYSGATLTNKSGNTYTVKASSAENAPSVDITITSEKITPTVVIGDNLGSGVSPIVGHDYTLTATYTNSHLDNSASVQYSWTIDGQTTTSNRNTITWTPGTPGSHKVSCSVKEGDEVAANSGETPYKVVDEQYKAVSNNGGTSIKLVPGANTVPITMPSIENRNDPSEKYSNGSSAPNKVEWDSTKLTIKSGSAKNVVAIDGNTITGLKTGSTTVVATVVFRGAKYKVEYDVEVKALDVELDSIANGDYESYDDTEFARILANKISDVTGDNFKASDVTSVKLIDSDRYLTFTTDSSNGSETKNLYQDFRIKATKGYLGDQSFKVSVNNKYTVTLTLTVVGAGSTIKDTVSGTAANKDVTFTNSDYKYLYYTTSKVNDNYNDCFDGNRVTGWEKADKNKTVTVKASEFNSNKTVTLNVVGVDSEGYASTGTITVSQKSYDINYNVVAGKSVTFNQKDFESFLEDYADDNGDYNSRKDELSFDHAVLTSSIPSAKSEGTLYYGSTEITSSNRSKTEMTDMDKVSFDSVSKPSKDTVTLTFRVYGEIEKPNSRKPDKVNYDVNVVISVVKEDITYTVGIDDTVQLTARDFVNFLQDAKTSYRKSTLDYVKFDVSGKNVSSYAYGGLYRSYSSYSTGKLADSTDKFYYEPSRTQYDLADVAYHTTRWAEAGKTVYIPFTVYGTKNEEASGTMAITIAQTMNFIDVKASDFFYEPVKWAVNNKITNGTSSTTFSPYKNCNRAEIVTFLWRAAGSPEPTVTRNPFTDVNSVRDASYYKAILWASQKGITAGTNATTFSPYQECTRSQIVTFLYRYAGKPSGNYTNPFKDVSSVNEASYYNAILWAVGKGITQGTSTTTFSPYASCTRGEAVTFLYRYVNGVK